MLDDVNDDDDAWILREPKIFFKDGFIYVLDKYGGLCDMESRFWNCYRCSKCECRIQTGIKDHIVRSDLNFHTHVPEDIQMHMSVNTEGKIVVSSLSIKPYHIDERARGAKASISMPYIPLLQVKTGETYAAAHIPVQSPPNMTPEHQLYSPLKAYKEQKENKNYKPEHGDLLDIEEIKESDDEELYVQSTSNAVCSVRPFPPLPQLLIPRSPSPEQSTSSAAYGPQPSSGQLQTRQEREQEREQERQLDAMMATIRKGMKMMGAQKWPYFQKMILELMSAIQNRNVGPFTRVNVYEEEPPPEISDGIGQPCRLQCCNAVGDGQEQGDEDDDVDVDEDEDVDVDEDDDVDEDEDVDVDEDEKDGRSRPELRNCPCNLT